MPNNQQDDRRTAADPRAGRAQRRNAPEMSGSWAAKDSAPPAPRSATSPPPPPAAAAPDVPPAPEPPQPEPAAPHDTPYADLPEAPAAHGDTPYADVPTAPNEPTGTPYADLPPTPERHDAAAHDGAEYDADAHDGAAYDAEAHDGSDRTGSGRTVSDRTGATRDAAPEGPAPHSDRAHPDAPHTDGAYAFGPVPDAAVERAPGTGERAAGPAGGDGAADTDHLGLLDAGSADGLERRARQAALGFIDGPRGAAREMDSVLAEAGELFQRGLADRRARLRHSWDEGGDDTEELRRAVREYRHLVDALIHA